MPVPSSVPQGSKLGPLLFILYVNDIKKFDFAEVKMYADNLTIYYAVVNNIQDKENLLLELNILVKWADKWQFKINFDYHEIHMGSKNKNFTYRLDLHNITVGQYEKILDVLMDCNLSFKEHVFETVKKSVKFSVLFL